MNIKQGDAWTVIGPCLICGKELTTKDGELNCYNPECQEYRKNLVVPEGWKITPFEKGFKYPVETEEPNWFIHECIDDQTKGRMKQLVEDLEVKEPISHHNVWFCVMVIVSGILIAVVLGSYLMRWLA